MLDDNAQALPIITSSIKTAFEKNNVAIQLEAFTSSFALMKENPCDILFTDIGMPEMGGIALVEEYTKLPPNVVSIFVSNREKRVEVCDPFVSQVNERRR